MSVAAHSTMDAGRAEHYFSRLSPLAGRICADLRDARALYEDLWPRLSPADREQVLTEAIIRPEVALLYPPTGSAPPPPAAPPLDPHGAPFSFRTRSQLDLQLFARDRAEPGGVASKAGMAAPTNSSLPKTGLDLLDNW